MKTKSLLSPRSYRMAERRTSTDATRAQIIAAAHDLLAAETFSEFSMDAIARQADVTRLTVYHQFESRAGLLKALYDDMAKRGDLQKLAEIFRRGGDPLRMLHEFIDVFTRFWSRTET